MSRIRYTVLKGYKYRDLVNLSVMNIYHEHLMDHFRNPRNRGTLEHADFASGVHNPSCGDSVSIAGLIVDGVITTVMFEGSGCVISQGAASMLTELVMGKTVEQALALNKTTMLQLVGLELGPTRMRCALLPLEALHAGLKKDEHAGSRQTHQATN